MALKKQHVNDGQLVHVSVALELLPDLGADCGDGEAEGVHGLDFGGLITSAMVSYRLKRNDCISSMYIQLGTSVSVQMVSLAQDGQGSGLDARYGV
jgi:hypothetical protein